jgi:hypothetical protein
MEVLNSEGEVTSMFAYGHHDFTDFTYACRFYHMKRPMRVRHVYHRPVWIKPEEGLSYQTTELCDKIDKEAKPITIGYP